MISIKIRMPVQYMDFIKSEAVSQRSTLSQYTEHLIRNGIAISGLGPRFEEQKDEVGIKVCSTLIRTGITSIVDTGAKGRMETFVMAVDSQTRLREIRRTLLDQKKRSTTLLFTDYLMEYLHGAADMSGQNIKTIMFMYLQLALAAWHLRCARSEDNPREDLERMDEILKEMRDTWAEFDIKDHVGLVVRIEKKTRLAGQERAKNLMALVDSKIPTTEGG